MNTTTATDSFDRQQALAGLTARATSYGWETIVMPFDNHFNLAFTRDLSGNRRELLWTRLSRTGRITFAERVLFENDELVVREVFRTDKRTAVQLAMSAAPAESRGV